MLGFLVGTACLIGLVKVVRGGGACGRGFGHHHHGWHGHGHRGWGGGRRHAGWGGWGGGWMRGLFERLDTSPGQEKVIKQSVEEIFASTRTLRVELDDTRRDIAAALRAGVVDEVQLGELFARQDEKLREVRKAMIGALARVTDALDETQRKELADLIERGLAGGGGWSRFGGGGPYRDGARGRDWA